MQRVDRAQIEALPEGQRAEALQLLEAYEESIRANPLVGYWPHAKQRVFHESRMPRKNFFGGNRSGKTTAGIVDDVIQAVDESCLPERLRPYKKWQPPFKCRIVAPDFTENMEGVIFEKLREWLPRGQLIGDSWDKAYQKQTRRLLFKNGSFFSFMTFEQDLDKFGGTALHRVHYDEEPPESIRNECKMRLADYDGDELLTMTPLQGLSWAFDVIWEPWVAGKLTEAIVVTVDIDDNPFLSASGKDRALEGYSAEELQARKSGRFVHFAGLIYPEFSPGRHVIPRKPVPEGIEVYVGIDPGMRHMAGVVFCFLDVGDVLTVFDELPLDHAIVSDVCKEILKVSAAYKIRPRWFVIDPSARNIVHQTGRSDQMEYADHGIYTIVGQNSVTAGINRVKERLQTDRLAVMANCTETIREFKRYRWATANRSEDDPKEKPVKRDDHCLVPGTLVTTARGDVAIEAVKIGDRVLTRGGYCTVVASAPTREVPVRTLRFDDGRSLTGSGDHPCVVQRDGRQFVSRLDAVRYGDMMLSCPGSRASSFTGSPFGAIQTRSAELTASIFARTSATVVRAWAIFTSRFGRPPSARFLTAGTSTFPSTTNFSTWSACPPANIVSVTWTTSAGSAQDGMRNRFGPSRRRGMRRRRDTRGMPSMAGKLGPHGSPWPTFATTAGASFNASVGVTLTASVPTTARVRGDAHQASMTSGVIARSAGSRFESTSIPGRRVAPVRVVANRAAGSSLVHNLTVYGHAEFFANGVLVLNCLDAVRYVCMSRPVLPPTPEEADVLKLPPLSRAVREQMSVRRRVQKRPPKTPFGGVLA